MRFILNLLLFCLLGIALADTEIRNFLIPDPHAPPATPPSVLDLHPRTSSTLHINSTTPELWARVPLQHGAWTARISWPASMPTRFELTVYPGSNDALLHMTAQSLSPRMRHPLLHRLGLASDPAKVQDNDFNTTFHIIVEPLYLGVLPATAVSAVAAILVMAAMGALAAPRLLSWVKTEARKEAVKKEQ